MISIIIPFHNEEKNLFLLYRELLSVLKKVNQPFEVILVDDGSTDKSRTEAETLVNKHQEVKLVVVWKQSGKGKALDEGIKASKGDIIVFMDADLQDDPKDLPKLLKKLEEGYDFVNGIRENRKDNELVVLYSGTANRLIRSLLKSPFTDVNCPFKVMKREVLEDITLYGNNFRFLPLAIYYQGHRVTEIPVKNRARKYGKTKFGPRKLFIGLLDTLTAYFLYRFAERPLHFFGKVGSIVLLAGGVILGYLAVERIFYGELLYRRPVLFLGMLLVIVGIQVITTGILGELIVYLNKRAKS